ncbi:MAG: hypothetical protein KGL39_37355, partial [Patescibacteria group bacterium]|nr:hypothetical protein [Patescibacteria group bacterium]
MNFEGAKPISVPRYGSSCQWDDAVLLPQGLARVAQNQRYTAQSTATRYGHSTRIQIAPNNSLTSGGLLRYLGAQAGTLNLQAVETVLLFAYGSSDGSISAVPPFLQAQLVNLCNAAFFSNSGYSQALMEGLNPVMAQAFNNLFVTLADLLLPSTQSPLVYNSGDGKLYPASDLPFGAPWQPGMKVRKGQVISPSTFETFGQTNGQGTWIPKQTGFLYQAQENGTTGAVQPIWPTTYEGTVGDNGITWEEATPIFISGLPDPIAPTFASSTPDVASPILNGATVYLAATFVNSKGEGINAITNTQGQIDGTKVLVWKNTTGASVDLTVTVPTIPAYLLAAVLGADYAATGVNLYAFIDQDSSASASQVTDPANYALVNTVAPVASGANVTLSAFPAGQQIPETSTAATTATVGNVDTGLRYLTVFFQTATLYQSGFTNSATVAVNVTQSGWPIQCLRLPIGPYNCIARVIAATVAGASAAGPFTYISQADVESPGFNQPDVQITATLIEDNTSTTATLNFTDTYLPGANDVTNYFDIIQIPPSVDVYFAKSLMRTVFTGAVGYQSGHLFSDIANPEMIRVPGGNFQVSEDDGDRTVCYREIRGVGYSFKENSGYAVEATAGDPSTWGARRIWTGTGPVGPAAIDVASYDDSGAASEIAVWAHRSGLYLFDGSAPRFISRERKDEWDSINWAYGHLIRVRIDPVNRLIYVMAPINGSTVINARLVVNYYFGIQDPVVFLRRSGKLVPNIEGRKWSYDPLSYNDALYIPQKSQNAVQQAGLDVSNNMVFFAADGSIKTVTKGQYYDQDYTGAQVGYFSNWISVL